MSDVKTALKICKTINRVFKETVGEAKEQSFKIPRMCSLKLCMHVRTTFSKARIIKGATFSNWSCSIYTCQLFNCLFHARFKSCLKD